MFYIMRNANKHFPNSPAKFGKCLQREAFTRGIKKSSSRKFNKFLGVFLEFLRIWVQSGTWNAAYYENKAITSSNSYCHLGNCFALWRMSKIYTILQEIYLQFLWGKLLARFISILLISRWYFIHLLMFSYELILRLKYLMK